MEITRLEWLVMEETSFFTGLVESTLLKFHHLFLGIKFCVSSTNIYYCLLPICIKLAHILNKSGGNYCLIFFFNEVYFSIGDHVPINYYIRLPR